MEFAILPKSYFITSGKAVSNVSSLNAFDKALVAAGIGNCNLVSVSSIIPKGAMEIKNFKFQPGSVVFAVLSRMDGKSGEKIGAGLGVLMSDDYGLVAEAHGFKSREELEYELRSKLFEMIRVRGMKNGQIKTKIESMIVPDDYEYGCIIVALVYVL